MVQFRANAWRATIGVLWTIHIGLAFYILFLSLLLTAGPVLIEGGFTPGNIARLAVAPLAFLLALRVGAHLYAIVVGMLSSRYDRVPEIDACLELPRSEYRELYQRVTQVSRRLIGYLPLEIRVSPYPACFAVERRRFGIWTRRQLTLVLGLPHVLVFNLTELQIVAAHELAHIALGDTRLDVFAWRFLESLRREREHRLPKPYCWIDPIHWLAAISHVLHRAALRRVRRWHEFRADCISARLFGGHVAAETLLKECLVGTQFEKTMDEWGVDADRPDELYAAFLTDWPILSDKGMQALEIGLAKEDVLAAGRVEDHPSVTDRLRLMRQFLNEPPRIERPVRELVPDWRVIARRLGPFETIATPDQAIG